MREIKADRLGGLVKVNAIVTRVSDVRPSIQIACYICEVCGNELFKEVTSRQFMPMQECVSATCKDNQTKGKLQMHIRGSKLLRFQEIKIQELVTSFFGL